MKMKRNGPCCAAVEILILDVHDHVTGTCHPAAEDCVIGLCAVVTFCGRVEIGTFELESDAEAGTCEEEICPCPHEAVICRGPFLGRVVGTCALAGIGLWVAIFPSHSVVTWSSLSQVGTWSLPSQVGTSPSLEALPVLEEETGDGKAALRIVWRAFCHPLPHRACGPEPSGPHPLSQSPRRRSRGAD
eukprot:TRINITY_DN4653_c0_g1_i4.p2 TRINITY_DN4653_c0_g1~~TRINITY_DN4653_c0_g1_i4.p2  ORF type:complete len:188 (+),score=25.21 TRINITY_DN4653_c0_g1_i4:503-1066(+)